MAKPSTLINRRNVLVASASRALALTAGRAIGQTSEQASAPPKAGFSFAFYGDSRPMMYLPSKEGSPDITQMFVEMFGLVMPEKVAKGHGGHRFPGETVLVNTTTWEGHMGA
jgi:hypothetical protein